MTLEEKSLLLRDLCARLPYGLKVKSEKYPFPVTILYSGNINEVKFKETGGIENICTIKLYLFPLSSITEGQKNQISQLLLDAKIEYPPYEEDYDNLLVSSIKQANALINYCLANHLDINCLIEKGLAIDATGLNIY